MIIINKYWCVYFAVDKSENHKAMKQILSLLVVSMLALSLMAANEDSKKESVDATSTTVNIIKGKVVDKITGEALAGVSVKLNDNTTVYTDFEGNFTLNITQSRAKICLSLISYASTEVEINRNSKEVKVELNAVE